MRTFDPCSLVGQLPDYKRLQDGDAVAHPDTHNYCRFYELDQLHLPYQYQQLGSLEVSDCKIALHRFVPSVSPQNSASGQPPAAAIILHGYLDHHGLYGLLIKYLLEHQLQVFCFDLPGHGLSTGESSAIANFELYQQIFKKIIEVAKQGNPQPIHLLGQSTGCAIINQYLLNLKQLNQQQLNHQSARIGQVVELAPLVRPADFRRIRLMYKLLNPITRQIPRTFTDNCNNQQFLDFIRLQDPLQSKTISVNWVGAMLNWLPQFLQLPSNIEHRPLIIQGENDATVDWKFNLAALHRLFPRAEICMLKKAKHHLTNETNDIRQTYLSWLDQHWFEQEEAGKRKGR